MIFGIGTDIIEIERIKASMERSGDKFAQRILSKNECLKIKENKFPERFLAKRFAAKEAFAKAMGTGIRNGLNMCDIELSHTELGKPLVNYVGNNAQVQNLLKSITNMQITISDEKHYAVAFVVLEN